MDYTGFALWPDRLLDTMNMRRLKTSTKNGVSVREQTYESLKSAIFSGKYSPGERLAEEHLAKELGVSRTPVREALHKLEQDGLIEPTGGRGFCIPRDSREEIEDLFQIRTVLEGYALKLICGQVTDEQIATLEALVAKADEALQRKRIEEVFQWNTQFHDTLHKWVADKRRFHSMIVNLRKYVLRYRKDTLQYLGAAKRTIDGHRQIILALKLRDPEICERMMRIHIRQSKEDALQTNLASTEEADRASGLVRPSRRV